MGRAFLPEEHEPGRHRVVVLTHGLWQRKFAGDPNIVGQVLSLDNESFTVGGRVAAGLCAARDRYATPERGIAYFQDVAQKLSALPGVQGTGAVSCRGCSTACRPPIRSPSAPLPR
jgi:hypothetical protein